MRRRLLVGFVVFALVALVAIEVPFGLSLAANARSTALSEIQNDAASLSFLVSSALQRGERTEALRLVDRYSRAQSATVVVVTNGKAVLSAGAKAVEELADPATKSILAAAAVGRVSGEQGGPDPDDDLLYVALPVGLKSEASASGSRRPHFDVVMLVAESAGPLHARITDDWIRLAVFGAALLVVAATMGALLARSLTRPLADIEATVSAFGAGRLSERADAIHGPVELRVLAESVNEMAGRLEELLDAQRAFVADASHQLRTPLTALRLRLENLEGAGGLQSPSDLALVIAEADRLSRVVDGLLALTRSEGVRAAREPVDVGAMLRERVEAWSALAEERNIGLEYRTPPSSADENGRLAALVCHGTLEQVLDNLLSNALDATPAGGNVSLTAESVDESIEIHVVDTGPGMSAEEREKAFERFWRKNGSSPEGTGLGLAIVAQLVRASGGATWLDNGTGGGVDAVVHLEAC